MKLSPIKNAPKFLCFILLALAIFHSCSKDEEDYNDLDLIKAKASTSLKAYAKASELEGLAPFKVTFSGNSSKNKKEIVKWNWTFGDGNRSGNKNPVHTFKKPGTYKVSFSARDNKGTTATNGLTIVVSDNKSGLKAYAKASNIEGKAPLKVTFSGNSSKNKKEIVKWNWTFGDGNRSGNKNPVHTFTKSGSYKVAFSIRDNKGVTSTDELTIVVNGNGNSGDNGDSGNGVDKGDYPSNAVFASDFGFRSGDATDAFVAAIRSGSSYVVIDKQSSDWVIRSTRFYDLKNMTIVFEPGVTLRAKPGAFGRGETLFELTRARNVTVEGTGATFRMNKGEYTDGEQRHGFEINVCNDVTVRGLTVRETGGAGIMISGDGSAGYSQNITLENIKSLNNRRDGLSFASAQDVWVRNSEFSGSSGTRPEAGVVLEPDNARDRLSNINFINCKFSDNRSAGFHFSAVDMNGSSPPISVKVVDSEFSNNAISPPSGFRRTEVEIGGGKGTNVVGGEIRFDRVKFNGSRGQIMFTRKSADGFKVAFKDCEARNVVTSVSEPPISLEANEIRSTLGGIEFDNFYIQYNKDVPFMKIQAPDKGGNFRVKDVRGSFTIKEPGDNPLTYLGSYRHNTDRNVNVSIKYKHH